MGGTRLTIPALAAVLTIAGIAGAHAADYSQPYYPPPQPYYPPPQQIIYQQPVRDFAEGWYLRGDIGVAMIHKYNLDWIPNPLNPPTDFRIESTSVGDAWFIGGGVGYEWNNWLRFDVTGEHRSKAAFDAI